MEWLQQNPVRDRGDIEFLTNEVLRLEEVLIRKVREQQAIQSVQVFQTVLAQAAVEDVDFCKDQCLTYASS